MVQAPFDELLARARRLAAGPRRVLGLAGPPGAGKSTLAARLLERLGPAAVGVPMDGFHLANRELDRLGRRQWKGAPDTFDAAGYVALLRRLREVGSGPAATAVAATVYAPMFNRDLEEAIAGAIAVPPDIPLIVTEGNYLLLEDGAWSAVRALLDEAWYIDINDALRLDRLIERHIRHGRSPAAAREWVLRSDEANAALIRRTRHRADLVVGPPA